MKVIGKMKKDMEKVYIIIGEELNMMENGKMIYHMEEVLNI